MLFPGSKVLVTASEGTVIKGDIGINLLGGPCISPVFHEFGELLNVQHFAGSLVEHLVALVEGPHHLNTERRAAIRNAQKTDPTESEYLLSLADSGPQEEIRPPSEAQRRADRIVRNPPAQA